MNLKERLVGCVLLCVLAPLAIVGYVWMCLVGTFGPTRRARGGVRALDHFVNATLLNGYPWESVSSHAWRVRGERRWARAVIWLTDRVQQDHCRKANKREQPLVDLVLAKGLHEQTVLDD